MINLIKEKFFFHYITVEDKVKAGYTIALAFMTFFIILTYLIISFFIDSSYFITLQGVTFLLVSLLPIVLVLNGHLEISSNILILAGIARMLMVTFDTTTTPAILAMSNMLMFFMVGLLIIKKYQLIFIFPVLLFTLPYKIYKMQSVFFDEITISVIVLYSFSMIIIFLVTRAEHNEIKARSQLQIREDEYMGLINNINGMIYSMDTKSRITSILNKKSLFNYTINDLKNNLFSWKDIIHRDDIEKYLENINDITNGKYKNIINYRIIDKNGNICYVEDHFTAYFDSKNEFSGTKGIIFDVSEKIKTEQKMKTNQHLIEQIFDTSMDAIRLIDLNFNITLTNKKYDKLSEIITADEIHNPHKKCFELLGTNDCNNENCTLKRIISGDQIIEKELYIDIDTKERYYTMIGLPFKDDKNNVAGIIEIFRDMTEQKEYNKHLIELKNRAEEANNSKSAFLAQMSHELRTPLNAVIGFSSLLEIDEENPDKLENIKIIKNSGEKLLDLISDILDLSRIESGNMNINQNFFEFNEIIISLVNNFEKRALDKNINLEFSIEDNLPEYIYGDQLKIEQILTNLIDNAIKFTEKGSVKVEVNKDKEYKKDILKFTISDTGVGISEENIDKIFNNFFQEEWYLSRKHSGSGLGLAITKNLIHLMGGNINVSSRKDKGTVFTIKIPLIVKEGDISEESQNTNKEKSMVVDTEISVLLAEDDLTNQELIKRLAKYCDFHLDIVSNGKDAVNKAKDNYYNVILMDIQMPVMNGIDAIKKIREFNSSICIIGLTAFAMKQDKDRIMDAGATAYVSKPIDLKSLCTMIKDYSQSASRS